MAEQAMKSSTTAEDTLKQKSTDPNIVSGGRLVAKALKSEGYRVIVVNSNPATIMTDPEFADATYVEPMTPEILELIIERELAGLIGGVLGVLLMIPIQMVLGNTLK